MRLALENFGQIAAGLRKPHFGEVLLGFATEAVAAPELCLVFAGVVGGDHRVGLVSETSAELRQVGGAEGERDVRPVQVLGLQGLYSDAGPELLGRRKDKLSQAAGCRCRDGLLVEAAFFAHDRGQQERVHFVSRATADDQVTVVEGEGGAT